MLAGPGIQKISLITYGVNPIKIDYSNYPKSFINRLKKSLGFSIKVFVYYRVTPIERASHF